MVDFGENLFYPLVHLAEINILEEILQAAQPK